MFSIKQNFNIRKAYSVRFVYNINHMTKDEINNRQFIENMKFTNEYILVIKGKINNKCIIVNVSIQINWRTII